MDGRWGIRQRRRRQGPGPAGFRGLDFEDSHTGSGGHGLRKTYFYSAASTGRKALARTVHRIYQNTLGNGTDYETRYYTDSFYGRPKGIRYPGGVGAAGARQISVYEEQIGMPGRVIYYNPLIP